MTAELFLFGLAGISLVAGIIIAISSIDRRERPKTKPEDRTSKSD